MKLYYKDVAEKTGYSLSHIYYLKRHKKGIGALFKADKFGRWYLTKGDLKGFKR